MPMYEATHWPRTGAKLLAPALLAFGLLAAPPSAGAGEHDAEAIARAAVSISMVMMMGEHEHEIEEALAAGDFEEAAEEAGELVPMMKGAPWAHDLKQPVAAASGALEELVARLEAKDEAGAKAAFEAMEETFHDLHHEVMEMFGEGHGH